MTALDTASAPAAVWAPDNALAFALAADGAHWVFDEEELDYGVVVKWEPAHGLRQARAPIMRSAPQAPVVIDLGPEERAPG